MKTRPQRQHKTRGFTLVELSIAVGVMSLLASSVLAGQGFIRAAQINRIADQITNIRKAIAVYAGRRGGKLPYDNNEMNLDLIQQLTDRRLIGDLDPALQALNPNIQLEPIALANDGIWALILNGGALDAQTTADLGARFVNDPFVYHESFYCPEDFQYSGSFIICFRNEW